MRPKHLCSCSCKKISCQIFLFWIHILWNLRHENKKKSRIILELNSSEVNKCSESSNQEWGKFSYLKKEKNVNWLHLSLVIRTRCLLISCLPCLLLQWKRNKSKSVSYTTDYGHPMKAEIKDIWIIGPMWQTKYAAAIPKNLGLGLNFRPCSEGYFLSGRP